MTATSMSLQNQAILVLSLWELGASGNEFKKSDLTKKTSKLSGKRDELLDDLVNQGLLILKSEGRTKFISLNTEFKNKVLSILRNPEFQFSAQVGKARANCLLQFFRELKTSKSEASTVSNGFANGNGKISDPIASYGDFKQTTLNIYDSLNKDFNMDNLVPIYRIRREMGDRISRAQFSEWLFEMQSEDVLQLLEGSVEDNTPDKLEDSVTTTLGKLRCYAKRLAD